MKRSFLSLSLAAAVLALCASTSAQQLRVPQDFETIQEALDSVNVTQTPTITISSGTYRENPVLAAGLNGLTVQGKGQVIIDALDGGDGFTIGSSNVTLKNLTIRHAGSQGVFAQNPEEGGAPLSAVTIDNVTVINSGSTGIELNADGAQVLKCEVFGCDGGIEVNGAGPRVERSTVRNDDSNGIEANGVGAMILRNEVHVIEDGEGIDVTGNNSVIDRNTVMNACSELIRASGDNIDVTRNNVGSGDSDGIVISGNAALAERNTVEDTCGDGIDISGANPSALNNRVSSVTGAGIVVEGLNASVIKNQVRDTGEDDAGIEVDSSSEANVEQNRVDNAHQNGIDFSGDSGLLAKNQVRNSGCEGVSEGGISVRGSDNTVENNTVQDCEGTGIYVRGNTNLLEKNKALRSSINGIFIDGDSAPGEGESVSLSNNLVSNQCTDNSGQGLHNRGVGTIVQKNNLKKNRQDLTNATSDGASLVDQGGNKFDTGGFMTEPEVLD